MLAAKWTLTSSSDVGIHNRTAKSSYDMQDVTVGSCVSVWKGAGVPPEEHYFLLTLVPYNLSLLTFWAWHKVSMLV